MREDGHFGFTRLLLTIAVETDATDQQRTRELAQKAEATCLVSASLDLPIETAIEVNALSSAQEFRLDPTGREPPEPQLSGFVRARCGRRQRGTFEPDGACRDRIGDLRLAASAALVPVATVFRFAEPNPAGDGRARSPLFATATSHESRMR